MLARHIQNSAIGHYSAIIRYIQDLTYAETWHTQNPGIFRTFPYLHPDVYSEPCHIYENLRIFKTLACLKPDKYLEPPQRFKMEFFLQK